MKITQFYYIMDLKHLRLWFLEHLTCHILGIHISLLIHYRKNMSFTY